LKIYILQGSLRTQIRCGGISSNRLISNFLHNVPVKKMENRSTFGEDMDKSLQLTFWPTL